MIIKNYELNKEKNLNFSLYLLYGKNEGLKNKVVKENLIGNSKALIQKYEEKEVLDNKEKIISELINKSFFDEEKIFIISRVSEKIIGFILEILEKKISDSKIILKTGILEKKSKLRLLFEKGNNMACVPFYPDELRILFQIANDFFKNKNIPISPELINLIVDRCSGDRMNLDNQLNKISLFMNGETKINYEQIAILTNLSENFSVSDLIENCLLKNSKKTSKILNENSYSSDECMLIIRTLLQKSKRILNLREIYEDTKNLDKTISIYKPPIFWKEKDYVKKQILEWGVDDIKKLIYKINDVELLIKNNSINSINILYDFLYSLSRQTNN